MATSSNGKAPEHFSKVVAPALVGFTLPTVAVVATQKDLGWGEGSLFCFLVSSGLLLAAFQLSIGRFDPDAVPSREPIVGFSLGGRWFGLSVLRFFLTWVGMLAMAAGLALIVLPAGGFAQYSWRLVAVVVLLAGAFMPFLWRLLLWHPRRSQAALKSTTSTRSSSDKRGAARTCGEVLLSP